MFPYYKKINITLLFLTLVLMFLTAWLWKDIILGQKNDVKQGLERVSIQTTTQTEKQESTETTSLKKKKQQTQDSTETTTDKTTENEDSEVVLPQTFSLEVPFTSQAPEADWSQPWQDACEEATVLMLDAYYKDYNLSPLFAKDEILKMVGWEKEKSWGRSIEAEKIAQMLEWYNKNNQAKIIKNPTVEKIKELVYNGTPVLVVAHGKTLDNPNFTGEGPEFHTLVISGYTETEFVTQDPGTRNGKNFKYTHENLMDALHDWNSGNVKEGQKVIITLEKNKND